MGTRNKRLNKEYHILLESEMVESVIVKDMKDSKIVWQVKVLEDRLPDYQKGLTVELRFGERYPFKPPEVYIHGVFHPNVYTNGSLCMSLLDNEVLPGGASRQEQWRASLGLSSVLVGVLAVLQEPNPDSPANMRAASIFTKDFNKYVERNMDLVKIRCDRKLREEQESSYRETLKEDKQKELVANQSEIKKRLLLKKRDEKEKSDQSERKKAEYSLPPEPAKQVTVRFIAPGETFQMRFLVTDKLSDLLLFIQAQGYRPEDHNLLTSQGCNLDGAPSSSLEEMKLGPMTTLNIQPIRSSNEIESYQSEKEKAAASLPDEPAELVSLRFRTPSEVLQRRFPATSKLSDVLLFLVARGYMPANHKILTDYPRRNLMDQPLTMTLEELKLCRLTVLTLQEISDDEDSSELEDKD